MRSFQHPVRLETAGPTRKAFLSATKVCSVARRNFLTGAFHKRFNSMLRVVDSFKNVKKYMIKWCWNSLECQEGLQMDQNSQLSLKTSLSSYVVLTNTAKDEHNSGLQHASNMNYICWKMLKRREAPSELANHPYPQEGVSARGVASIRRYCSCRAFETTQNPIARGQQLWLRRACFVSASDIDFWCLWIWQHSSKSGFLINRKPRALPDYKPWIHRFGWPWSSLSITT